MLLPQESFSPVFLLLTFIKQIGLMIAENTRIRQVAPRLVAMVLEGYDYDSELFYHDNNFDVDSVTVPRQKMVCLSVAEIDELLTEVN